MIVTGLDLATTSGLTTRNSEGVYIATTYKAGVKRGFLDRKDGDKLDPKVEGLIARKFEDFLHAYFIDNGTTHVGIEAPLPSNKTRTKQVVDLDTKWAGKSIRYEEQAGTSMASIYRIYGLSFIAAGVASRLNLQVDYVHQGTWRKDFLGNGRPKDAKQEAKKKCQALGIVVSSLDAAESVGVAWCLYHQLNPADRPGDLFEKPKTLAQLQIEEAANAVFKPRA